MTLHLNGEEMPAHPTTLESVEMASTTIATAMTLNSKGKEMSTHATMLEDMVVSPTTMNLKCEEMPAHPTTLEVAEVVSAITLNSKPTPATANQNLATNAG